MFPQPLSVLSENDVLKYWYETRVKIPLEEVTSVHSVADQEGLHIWVKFRDPSIIAYAVFPGLDHTILPPLYQ